jgi:hypothetical protein
MTAQTVFRMLEHPKSTHFCGREMRNDSLSREFKARDFASERESIKWFFISPNEKAEISAKSERALSLAELRRFSSCSPCAKPFSEREKSFFMEYYPMSMIRDGVLSQLQAEFFQSLFHIDRNNIRTTKHNLTSLFAMLCGEKPLSIITSSSPVYDFSGASKADFGRHGAAFFHPLDKSSWVASLKESSFLSVKPDIFYTDMAASGRMLGYPESAVRHFADGGNADGMRLLMFDYDLQFRPWLFDGVFVPKIDMQTRHILGEDILYRWHEMLERAVGDRLIGLLSLEAKITTIIKLAAAIESENIRLQPDTTGHNSG